MDDLPPPLLFVRREALLRGPLILTAVSRFLLPLFFLTCVLADVRSFRTTLGHPRDYVWLYVVDEVLLAATLWFFFLFSVLLAWLFFSRRRMFRPLMIYFGLLVPLFFVAVAMHTAHFPPRHRSPTAHSKLVEVFLPVCLLFGMVFWPFYYLFSPRVKRVFVR